MNRGANRRAHEAKRVTEGRSPELTRHEVPSNPATLPIKRKDREKAGRPATPTEFNGVVILHFYFPPSASQRFCGSQFMNNELANLL